MKKGTHSYRHDYFCVSPCLFVPPVGLYFRKLRHRTIPKLYTAVQKLPPLHTRVWGNIETGTQRDVVDTQRRGHSDTETGTQ